MIKNLKKKKKAFTLVEVIIVLAIIAIIAAIAIPNLTKVRQQSKIKADTQSLATIERTINMLITDETLPVDGTQKVITFTFGNDKKVETVTVNGTANSTILDYFKDIRQPQSEDKTNYKVTVSSTGEITSEMVARTAATTVG